MINSHMSVHIHDDDSKAISFEAHDDTIFLRIGSAATLFLSAVAAEALMEVLRIALMERTLAVVREGLAIDQTSKDEASAYHTFNDPTGD